MATRRVEQLAYGRGRPTCDELLGQSRALKRQVEKVRREGRRQNVPFRKEDEPARKAKKGRDVNRGASWAPCASLGFIDRAFSMQGAWQGHRLSADGLAKHGLVQEGTQRQYALREKALALGWSESQIRVLDRDLGLSGDQSQTREDFETLLAELSVGEVGGVLALRASRLGRSNMDWHRLLELRSVTGTLLLDEDGCYDPADFKNALLLGMK
jgi:hypothetical protein